MVSTFELNVRCNCCNLCVALIPASPFIMNIITTELSVMVIVALHYACASMVAVTFVSAISRVTRCIIQTKFPSNFLPGYPVTFMQSTYS